MILLFFALFFIACALTVSIFTLKDDTRNKPAGKIDIVPLSAQPKCAVPLEEAQKENEKALEKFKKLKEERQGLEDELAAAKKNGSQLTEELNKVKSWIEKDKAQEENTKKELYALKEALVKKDEEYEKEFALNLSLKKELGEYKQKCGALENLQRENTERLRISDAHLAAYKEELKAQNQVIAELKKKSHDTEWVSKKEYEELKAKLVQAQGNGKEKI